MLAHMVLLATQAAAAAAVGPTMVTEQLNALIHRDKSCIYCGGKGIIVRNPFDYYSDEQPSKRCKQCPFQVVPATFWSNDIFTPSQLYVTAVADNVDCPNDGTNGFFDLDTCPQDPNDPAVTGGWNYAVLAYAFGTKMNDVLPDYDLIQTEDWGWGVFYPTDSNSVDVRCQRLDDDTGYDCPEGILDDQQGWLDDASKRGSGDYDMGNPDAGLGGGGAGCHYFSWSKGIDQVDAYDSDGDNIVMDYNCQCNYKHKEALHGDYTEWWTWIDTWIQGAVAKPDTYQNWLGATGQLAPSKAFDSASCWMNNPRDMIMLQNQFFWQREAWNNQLAPKSQWSKDPISQHVYWGWNEVPIASALDRDKSLRDAVIIKLPGAICSGTGAKDAVHCLHDGAHIALERNVQEWVDEKHMVPGIQNIGQQPGSDVVWVREFVDQEDNWQREFFCDYWNSPSNTWKVEYITQDEDVAGCCFLDYAKEPKPSKCPKAAYGVRGTLHPDNVV